MPLLTKYFLIAGVLLILAGIVWWLFGDKLSWMGRLPGDIRVENESGGFYFPLVTCILISVVLTLIFWLIRKFF